MAYLARYQSAVLSGSISDFAIPFPYLRKADVLVYSVASARDAPVLLTSGLDYVWTSSSVIHTVSPLPAGYSFLAIRNSDRTGDLLTRFSSPSVITAEKLNAGFTQLLYISQEAQDTVMELSARVITAPIGQAFSFIAQVVAVEGIGAGDFVNVVPIAGVPWVRRAIATDPDRFASGFSPGIIPAGVGGLILTGGLNPATTGIDAPEVWLSDTVPGGFMTTPPEATPQGVWKQVLGPAISGQGILFSPRDRQGMFA